MTPADRSLTEARATLIRERLATIKKYDDAIQALDRIIGDGPPATTARSTRRAGRGTALRKSSVDAVIEILEEQPGRGLAPDLLAQALEARGMPLRSDNLPRAARAAGNRAREKDPRVKLENGEFVFRPAESDPAPSEELTLGS